MSALLTSLPGDIPGLLRRGSPILVRLAAGWSQHVVTDPPDLSGYGWACRMGLAAREFHPGHVALDLTDPTGRAHAAWWCNERAQTFLWPTDPRGEDEAVMLACLGGDMTPEQIDTLARLVLRLAGRAA